MRTLILLSALLLILPAFAASKNDEVDYLGLATLLTRDGEYARAEQALANIDPAAAGVDLIAYHTVRGLLALEQQKMAAAVAGFSAALAAGQDDPLVYLYLAQAHFGLEHYRDALAALDSAGDGVVALSGAWLMRAHAHWMLGERQAAMDTLSAAGAQFPGNFSFMRRQVFYLIDAGLNLQAAELGRRYLELADGKSDDYIAIGTALRRAGSIDEALRFLETARLRFADDAGIDKALAQAWLGNGDPLAAAEILASAALHEPALNLEAAELFRRAGHYARALRLNALIADPQAKLKQRIGILIEQRRYDEVAASEAALARAGLLDDQDLRYALAYAWYRIGDHAAAERNLVPLQRPELFRKATELRRLMQECADARWTCA
ncbi:MAG: hypothetical protein COW59_00790 [Lysobacterales bacterium CG17_big_fil_post_rev_8_21_14_2_50_64_11]|nr:MAG: hypothetical protein COW59_00790 [Xanthomonadales bacterium CG17_big_fil_post_rev_8_21_14_2_50_64_11]PIX60373.1 MAG: hypothetical protein COZ47_07585 [Xanthomonadales bacterium CG_4_10_14_3_um_filter_64_11]